MLGYDYGGSTTKWFVLFGGDFVMMNPTLARRAVRESPELQREVSRRVRALSERNARERLYSEAQLKWAFLREATFVAGESARKAL